MDLSLDDLLSGLEAAQQKKSKVRLSERNVVELVAKLRALGLLGDELLYTTNGKEYVTRQRAEAEVRAAVRAAGGRIPLVDLPTQLGLDLVHCERAAEAVVAASGGAVTQAQGELFSTAYFDGLAAEVDEALQEAGVAAVGDLARRFGLGAEMAGGVLAERVASGMIRGRLEAGVIYTQAYLQRIKAQLRGALRGAVSPVAVPSLVRELGIEGLASLNALVPSLVEELAAEGAVAGKLAAGAASWVPAAYAASQQDAVRAFFQQNGHIGYDTVKQYGIPNARAFLAQHFPDGHALESAYVSPAVVGQVEAAVEEALAPGGGGWCDVLPHVPPALTAADAGALLGECKAAGAGGARLLAGTCVVSGGLLDALQARMMEAARKAADEAHQKRRAGGAGAAAAAGAQAAKAEGSKKAAAAAAKAEAESDDDDWDMGGKKGKKGKGGKKGGKGGSGGGGGGGGAKSKPSSKAASGAALADAGEPGGSALSVSALAQQVLEAHPDMEGAGAGGDLPEAVAAELRPAVVAEYERALRAIFTAGADRRRRLREAAAAALDASYERLQLHSHGAELFAEDEATAAVLQRHLLRGTGAECVDALLRYLHADAAAGQEGEEGGEGGDAAALADAAAGPLTPAQRAAVLKQLPPDVRPAAAAAVDKLNGSSLEAFTPELDAAAEAAGLRLRRLDKKGERALVFAQRKAWEAAAAAAPDASTLLALAVPLLLARQHGRVVSLPGRALAPAVELLRSKGGLAEEACQLLADFHAAVVEQLKQQSGGGDEAAAAALAGQLEALTPRVRALAAAGGDKGGEGGEA